MLCLLSSVLKETIQGVPPSSWSTATLSDCNILNVIMSVQINQIQIPKASKGKFKRKLSKEKFVLMSLSRLVELLRGKHLKTSIKCFSQSNLRQQVVLFLQLRVRCGLQMTYCIPGRPGGVDWNDSFKGRLSNPLSRFSFPSVAISIAIRLIFLRTSV